MLGNRIMKLWLPGVCSYQKGLELQNLAKSLMTEKDLGTLIVLQHNPVYTIGIRKYKINEPNHLLSIDKSHLLDLGAEFYETNRGGLITFHGPGQLVAYPILNLQNVFDQNFLSVFKFQQNLIKLYIKTLIDSMTEVSRFFGANHTFSKITPSTLTGAWHIPNLSSSLIDIDEILSIENDIDKTFIKMRPQKVGAIGIRFSNYNTSHGIALNCNVDLKWYNDIDPCGLKNSLESTSSSNYSPVTSLSQILDKDITVKSAIPVFLEKFEKMFMVALEEHNI